MSKSNFCRFLASLLVAGLFAAGATNTRGQDSVALTGSVTDRVTGAPLGGVSIHFNVNQPPIGTTYHDGTYSLTDSTIGGQTSATLVFVKQGYYRAFQSYSLINLPGPTLLNISLLNGGVAIRGQVRSSVNGAPIPAAVVGFTQTLPFATADSTGTYSIDSSLLYEVGFPIELKAFASPGYFESQGFEVLTPPSSPVNIDFIMAPTGYQPTILFRSYLVPGSLIIANGLEVDGQVYSTRQDFIWAPSSIHSIKAPSPISLGDTRWVFQNWNIGGSIFQNIYAPFEDTEIRANYQAEYLINTNVSPSGSGTITAGGWFPFGHILNIVATPLPGFEFAGFSGDLQPSPNSQSIFVGLPRNITAHFVPVGNTTPGENVPILNPIDTASGQPSPIDLNFSNVTGGGSTSVTSSQSGPPPPKGFRLGNPPTYYDISTTATFTGAVTVCINYSSASYNNENTLRLWHLNTSTNLWEDITTTLDTTNKVICGQTTSLSPFVVMEQDLAPEFEGPANIEVAATSAAGATVSYTVPTATDDSDSSVPVDCTPPSGNAFGLGSITVTCTAIDSAGNTTSKSFTIKVVYDWSGILQPINADGSSIFKLKSTVPIKFLLVGQSSGIQNASVRLFVSKVSNGVTGTEVEALGTATATSGNVFRYEGGQYVFNWGTKNLTAGTYQLRIDMGDGVTRTSSVSLR
jgi:hypothetical protein